MKRVWAIARVSARGIIRSRGVLTMAGLLLAMLPALLGMMRDDGTAEGFIQLAIQYPSALVFALLSIMAVWSGSAAVSGEITDRTIQLIASKPVASIELWAGKWLGLLLVLTALLIAGKSAGFFFVTARLADWRDSDPARYASAIQQLAAHRSIAPAPGSGETVAIKPGGAKTWRYPPNAGKATAIEYRIFGSSIGQHRTTGRWTIATLDGREIAGKEKTSPAGAWSRIEPAPPAVPLHQGVVVRYENTDTAGVPILFTAEGEPNLLIPVAGFGENYLRGLLIDWCRLALIAAIAVSAGSLLSLPVAALVSFFLVVILQIAPMLPSIAGAAGSEAPHHHGEIAEHKDETGPLTQASQSIVRGLSAVTSPIHLQSGTGQIAAGRLIENTRIFRALGHGILLPLIIGGACSVALRRRELALPEK